MDMVGGVWGRRKSESYDWYGLKVCNIGVESGKVVKT